MSHSLLAALLCLTTPALAAGFSKGDTVKLTHREMIQVNGKNLQQAPKGMEFTVLSGLGAAVTVEFYKDDGTLTPATLPAEALEAGPRDVWGDVLRGVEAFRDQRFDESKRTLSRPYDDAAAKPIAAALATRIAGALAAAGAARSSDAAHAPVAKQAFATTLQGLRDTADQLVKLNHTSLAVALDEGAERLAALVPGTIVPPAKIAREDLAKRVAISNRAVLLGRQALGLHRLVEAAKQVEAGLAAEPARAELIALQPRIRKGREDADDCFKDADKLRTRGHQGVIHALSSLDDGLRLCADHPQLLTLKKEMQAAFEERTAPPVTPAFLAAAKPRLGKDALDEARTLYTEHCTECHDLEMLDSRSIPAWEKTVAGMSRRASLSGAQQASILEYLTAAQKAMESGKAD